MWVNEPRNNFLYDFTDRFEWQTVLWCFLFRRSSDQHEILNTYNVLFTLGWAPDLKFISQISFTCIGILVFPLNVFFLSIQELIFNDFDDMVDSMSTSSSLELTRNPFDDGQEERVNCPGFSPSMFIKQETPASQKVSKTVGIWIETTYYWYKLSCLLIC